MKINRVLFDNAAPLSLIAGPCVIESEEMILETAVRLKEICAERGISLVFKSSFDKANRQSLASFRGPGLKEGLRILAAVKEETGLPILTDIHETAQAGPAAEVADILQIPAFLCRQTDLLVAAAKTGRIVNVKKGQFVSPAGMGSVLKKLNEAGCPTERILLTERGASFGYGDLVVDMRSLEEMKRLGAGVIFDATHSVQRPDAGGGKSGGLREFVPVLSRAAVAVGIAGLFMEVHPNITKARCDAANQWPLEDLPALLDSLLAIDRAVKENQEDASEARRS